MPEFTSEELSEAHRALLSALHKCEKMEATKLGMYFNPFPILFRKGFIITVCNAVIFAKDIKLYRFKMQLF